MFRCAAQRTHEHGDVHGRLQAFTGDIADDYQQPAAGRGLHVVEVAAHLVGRVVDGVHFKARSCELLLWNHQLLHAAGSGKFAGCVLLFTLHAQEAYEDDEHDGKDACHIGERAEVDGNGSGVQGEGRLNLAAFPIVDAGNHGHDPACQGQQQRKKQQASLEVAL